MDTKKILVLILILNFNCFLSSEIIWEDGFETNNDWSLNGEFEIDIPQGLGGNYGNPDPQTAFAGEKVLGVDLTGTGDYPGDYEADLEDREVFALSPPINCSEFINVELKFQRWLNVEQSSYDHAYIDISNDDGISWTELWTNSATITDDSWNEFTYDISQLADMKENVRLRFSIGATDGSWQYCGWNLDEIKLIGEQVEYGAIAGNIIDDTNNQPIEFAQVMNDFGNTISDENGYFLLPDIPEGERTISVFALGYLDFSLENINVIAPDTTFVVCALTPNPNLPPSPQNLQAQIIQNDVALSWEYPFNEELLAYNIYRDGIVIQSVIPENYLDADLINGEYFYFVTAVHDYGESLPSDTVFVEITAVDDHVITNNIALSNHPNPFNPSTTISFNLAREITENTEIIIYNLKGQTIKTFDLQDSNLTDCIEWNGIDQGGKRVSSGLYIYQLMKDQEVIASQKMLLFK